MQQKGNVPAKGDAKAAIDLSGYDPNKFNVLTPLLRLDTAAPWLRLRAVEMTLDADHETGDVYAAPGTRWEKADDRWVPISVALRKEGLLKIAKAVGLVIDANRSGRIEPSSHSMLKDLAKAGDAALVRELFAECRYDVCYRTVGAIRTDAGWHVLKAEYEWELEGQRRKIQREAEKRAEKARSARPPREFDTQKHVADRLDQVISERFGLAESKSLLRLIRAICSIRQSYPRQHLQRPFLTVRAELAPDLADPALRRAMLERALASEAELFGARQALPAATRVVEELAGEPDFSKPPEDVGGANANHEPAPAPAQEEPPAEQEPPAGEPPPEQQAPPEQEAPPEKPPPEQTPPPEGKPAPKSSQGPEPPANERYRCGDCGKMVPNKVVAYCRSPRGLERFGGRILCFACQQRMGQTHQGGQQ